MSLHIFTAERLMHPANKLVNQRRRTNRARRFPDNTRPSAAIQAEGEKR